MSNVTFQQINPHAIKWQFGVIKTINNFDYSKGVLQILLSGSVGSAKSSIGAHCLAKHLLKNKGARALVLRRTLKDLKRTFWRLLLDHISDISHVVRVYNKSEMRIVFKNGSEVLGDSYDDMNLEKFRSLELSFALIEEATESNRELYRAVFMRLGRVLTVKENIMMTITNPDGLSHYLYTDLIESTKQNVKVIYSLTSDNKFLPDWYIDELKSNLDEKMAQRMLYGQWVDIASEGVYYNYEKERNFKDSYVINPNYPICIAHDFNIGKGKPMSTAAGQFIDDTWHWFKSYHVEGANTHKIMEEMAGDGLFENKNMFIIYGDATGRSRDTRSIVNDYEIIEEFLEAYERQDGSKLEFEIDVPRSNPPIKKRHNLVNAYFQNMKGKIRCFIYDDWLDRGFRLTKFSKDSLILEDDSLAEQHATTAIGYAIVRNDLSLNRETRTIQL
jgi:hypothetical protein